MRVTSIAALIAASLWALYLVIGNGLLVTGWVESRVSGKPEKRWLELGSAWTIWPGRVHVRDFRLRHADEDVQLEIRFERATLDIDLAALMRKQLHVSHLDAEGTRFRLRRLLDDPARDSLRARALPRIEGLPDDVRAGPEEDEAPQKGKRSRPWTFTIAGIDARLEELWVDEFKYLGPGRIRGAFRFEPDREIEVRDSEVVLGPGVLGFGEQRPIAHRVAGSIQGRVETLDVSDDARLGWRAFRRFSLDGALVAEVNDLEFTEAYTRREGIDLGGGGGTLEILLAVDRGRFGADSYVEYRTDRLEIASDDIAFSGDARVVLDTTERRGRTRGRAHVAGRRIDVRSGKTALGDVRDLELELLASNADLSRKWRAHGGSLNVGAARVPNLARLNVFKNGGDWSLSGGALTASASALLDRHGKLSGRFAVRAESAAARIGDVRVRATGTARARLAQPTLSSSTGQLRDARVHLARFSFATPTGWSGPGSLRARARRIGYRAFEPEEFDLRFASAFESADGVLDALDVASSGASRVARLFVDLEDLRVRGSVRYDSGKLGVEIEQARTDGVEARGSVVQGAEQSSRFEVDLGLFELSNGSGR